MEIQPLKVQKPKFVRRPSYTLKNEEIHKSVKFESGAAKKIQRPASPHVIKPFKLSKENIEERFREIQTKYPIDHLILKFKQAAILLESNHEKGYLETLVEPLIHSLQLEIEIQVCYHIT